MSDNYPAGAANDPKAPWNQPEPVFIECESCEGTGMSGHDCGEDTCNCSNPEDNLWCLTCEGTGEIESEDED